MGCIMFESVLWLLYGNEVQHSFANETTQETPVGTIYWTPESMLASVKTARVNELTTKCINHMMANDPECRPGTAVGDVLALIKEKLLVVKLPVPGVYEPGCRANASILLKRLSEIRDKASINSNYILTGISREGIIPPISHLQPIAVSGNGMVATNSKAPKCDSMLELPSQSMEVPSRKTDTYTHAFQDVWEYIHDDSFAKQLLEKQDVRSMDWDRATSSTLCQLCKSLDFYSSTFKLKIKLSELRTRAKSCNLCKLLAVSAITREVPETAVIEFDRTSSGLRLNRSGPPVLSICRTGNFTYPEHVSDRCFAAQNLTT
jgi:hypothetical protein